MRSKLTLTPERTHTVLDKGDFSQREKDHVLVLIDNDYQMKKARLPASHYEVFSDWQYRALLFSYDLDTPRWSTSELASRLHLTEQQVREMIEDLLRLKLLQTSPEGEVVRENAFWEMSEERKNDFMRRSHRDNSALATIALEKIDPKKRDITTLTFAGNSSQLENLRQEIRHFYERTLSVMEVSPKDEVYQMSIQVYPVNLREAPTPGKEK